MSAATRSNDAESAGGSAVLLGSPRVEVGGGGWFLPDDQSCVSGVTRDAIPLAIKLLAAWSSWERGEDELLPALQAAYAADDAPPEVTDAIRVLAESSLREWTADEADAFDPVAACDASGLS